MKKTFTLIILIIVLVALLIFVKSVVSEKENKPAAQLDEYENIDMSAVCNSALAYMSFTSGEAAHAFITECLDGLHPEVLNRYLETMRGDEAAGAVLEAPVVVEPIIDVTSPQSNVIVANPISVSGTARGYWFFEATAPVDVYNEGAAIIGQGFITATESWMTEDFIPFTGTITFEENLVASGEAITLVFNRANPSGIPDNAESVSVSVIVE